MIFLNAGVSTFGLLQQLTDKECQDIITLSALHPLYLTKALIQLMTSRPERGAIISTSSSLGCLPIPGVTSYSASKRFQYFFSQALSYELKDKVDVLAWLPAQVST